MIVCVCVRVLCVCCAGGNLFKFDGFLIVTRNGEMIACMIKQRERAKTKKLKIRNAK